MAWLLGCVNLGSRQWAVGSGQWAVRHFGLELIISGSQYLAGSHCLLPTAYCPLPTAYCLLLFHRMDGLIVSKCPIAGQSHDGLAKMIPN
jgi:hypothetical protein